MTADPSRALACGIVAEALRCAPEDVTADAAVGSLPGWDSIAHVNIVLAVEERLGRPLTADEIGAVATVADFAGLLSAAPTRGAG